MKLVLILGTTIFWASVSLADGFLCNSESGLRIRLYNHTTPEAGTRNAAVLVLSKPTATPGQRTLARFSDSDGTLTRTDEAFVGKSVDRPGKKDCQLMLFGPKRRIRSPEIAEMRVEVDFSYASPVSSGETLTGTLTLIMTNGQAFSETLSCLRYLKTKSTRQ